MAKKKIIVYEGSKLFNILNNYKIVEKLGGKTPEILLQEQANVIIEKIKTLNSSIDMINNGVLKLVINEKIAAYKDSLESILKIGQIINQFSINEE